MGTNYTEGLAATNKIAVGGAFLKYHVVTVGCLEDGDIMIDGAPVLTTFPFSLDLADVSATIRYDSEGTLVDAANQAWERRIVHLDLPLGVSMTIMRWSNYVDFRLVMPQQPDQDSHSSPRVVW